MNQITLKMDQCEDIEPFIKRKKPNDKKDTSAIAVFPKRAPDILKLDIDCFEEAFDYLPLKDLISIGKTCKRLEQVAGYCFQEYFPAAVIECRGGLICINNNLKSDGLTQFIRKIRIDSIRDFMFFLNNHSKFHRLRQIKMGNFQINKTSTVKMTKILSKIEFLRFHCCKINGDFYDTVLSRCPNLKRLSLEGSPTDPDWLERKYPTMERVELISNNIDGIGAFLVRNPNVKKLAINAVCLWQNRTSLLTANISLDDLAIRVIDGNEVDLSEFCRFLNELHARGFYQHLHLYSLYGLKQKTVREFATLNGLVKVYISHVGRPVALSSLTSIQELCVFVSDQITDLDAAISTLTHLKRIQFRFAHFNGILMLIKKAAGLMRIKVDYLENGEYFSKSTNAIDLFELNKEREQLQGARKITIYVKEDIYLATKWAMIETDLRLIRLRRIDSFEWDHDFGLD